MGQGHPHPVVGFGTHHPDNSNGMASHHVRGSDQLERDAGDIQLVSRTVRSGRRLRLGVTHQGLDHNEGDMRHLVHRERSTYRQGTLSTPQQPA